MYSPHALLFGWLFMQLGLWEQEDFDMNYTQAQAAKEIRKIAKDAGMTFKRQNARINGKQAYMFTDRLTGIRIISNCTFWSAYECCMSGYVAGKAAAS